MFNNVGGYNSTLRDNEKTITTDYTERVRLRFVNLSSLARFYIFFADRSNFEVVELDGISYENKKTNISEVSSGQSVSIIVIGRNPRSTYSSTYIVAASDPKISHGIAQCPMPYMRADRDFQITHGYLNMRGPKAAAVQDCIKAGSSDVDIG